MGPGASYKGTWSYQGRGWDRPKKQSYGRDSGEEKPVKETERQQLERQEENQARRRKC